MQLLLLPGICPGPTAPAHVPPAARSIPAPGSLALQPIRAGSPGHILHSRPQALHLLGEVLHSALPVLRLLDESLVACSQVADVFLHSVHLLGKATKAGSCHGALNSGGLQAGSLVVLIGAVPDPRDLLLGGLLLACKALVMLLPFLLTWHKC